MLDPLIFSTPIIRKIQERNEIRYLHLLENVLIINKNPEFKEVSRRFDLTSMYCQIIWTYVNNKLEEMILYDAKLNAKKVYVATQDKLKQLQSNLNGRAYYRNFHQFYQKLQNIIVQNNVEVQLCFNLQTMEVKVAKVVKFKSDKLDETDKNCLIRNEAKIFQKLSYHPHPYILGAEQIFISDQSVTYVMNYCTGGTLYDYLFENELHLSDQITREIMRELLQGVNHLHQLGIMHRDLKLENVMFEKKNDLNTLKIIDFRFSTYFDSFTVNEQRCGTIGYLAPEIFNMESYNELCDIYSVGCIFYALLTGKKILQTPEQTKTYNPTMLKKQIKKYLLQQTCSQEAIDLLQQMLSIQRDRPCVEYCLQHQYFEQELQGLEECSTELIKLEFPVFRNPFSQ